jgi:hypothetical protein
MPGLVTYLVENVLGCTRSDEDPLADPSLSAVGEAELVRGQKPRAGTVERVVDGRRSSCWV